ncbi:MAG: HAMP domain-containing histidine kinase [Nitrospirae bacterium]|nr:HAMP domain-containing histidine kinase [Nitrospirota bacterium]
MKETLNITRYVLMLLVAVFIWLVLGMVYMDRFITPFDKLIPWLMPWKESASGPGASSIEGFLSVMQAQLDGSKRVADYAFFTMIVSFALFCAYLTFVYQQKQGRARENELLMLKNQEIARRNEFIRYITATIGHEFKNNLGRIKRRIDLLHDLPGEVKDRLDDNMEKLFADIDIFKKISDERETVLISFEQVDLKEMVVTLSGHYADLADFNFQDSSPTPAIFASPALLKTVFENLIDNAIKYKKPEQERALIAFSCSVDIDSNRRYVALSFRDQGIGMDEQEADQCFYKSKASNGGWGQGLYFAKYVIGLHAGKIKVGKEHTAPGKGTEIIINLPLVEETL